MNVLRVSAISVACMLMGPVVFAQSTERTVNVNFEDMVENTAPEGFSMALSGQGAPPLWIVQRDEDNKVLSQTVADPTNYRFPLCVFKDFSAKDVELSVRFKPISGRVDQAGGLLWRFKDDQNYYVVRANARENNVVLYKIQNGKRTDLRPVGARFGAYGKDAPVPQNEWSELRVTVRGIKFSISLNGIQLFEVEDSTFSESGRVGLWTKADSVTSFDDFSAVSFDK